MKPTILDAASRMTMVDKPKRKNWIKGADIKAGAFTKKADAAGKSVHALAQDKKDAPGKTGKQARLALAFEGMAHKKKALTYPNSSHKD